jgi:uncharacterized protein YndB with AHSA1/START domain
LRLRCIAPTIFDMQQGTIGQAQIRIEAPPATVYSVVSDVTRMGEWSPETYKCEWVDGATGPAVGARFKGNNKRGALRWSTRPDVVAADPGKEFAFEVKSDVRWTYRFAPEGTGTVLTESFEMLRDLQWYYALVERWLMGVKDRKADLERSMAETLQRIKQSVEASQAA